MGITTKLDPIPIWPDMRLSFALFVDAIWQWVPIAMAAPVRTRIIRTELESSARLLGVEITPAIFQDIKTMEDEALRIWSRKR